ncbi:MAG: alpha/beta fold hydrolase [Pseudomonadota bacterium]
MLLFASRRTYDTSKKRFTNNPASLTRYASVSQSAAMGGALQGALVTQDQWLSKVQAHGDGRDVLVYVHGFNTSQRDLFARLGPLRRDLQAKGFGGTVVAYDWPSDGSVLKYRRDKRDAKATASHLVTDVLAPLRRLSPRPRIHVLAHSMGCYLTLRAFAAFGDGPSGGWTVDQVLFTAADADSQWLEKGAWGALVLGHRAKRFTNYYNPRDDVLALSRLRYNGGRARAGRAGIPAPRASRHVDVYCQGQYDRDVSLDGLSDDAKLLASHNWWYGNDGYLTDVALTLAGTDASAMPTRRPSTTDDLALLS